MYMLPSLGLLEYSYLPRRTVLKDFILQRSHLGSLYGIVEANN